MEGGVDERERWREGWISERGGGGVDEREGWMRGRGGWMRGRGEGRGG